MYYRDSIAGKGRGWVVYHGYGRDGFETDGYGRDGLYITDTGGMGLKLTGMGGDGLYITDTGGMGLKLTGMGGDGFGSYGYGVGRVWKQWGWAGIRFDICPVQFFSAQNVDYLRQHLIDG